MGVPCPRCSGLVTNDELGIDLHGQVIYADLLRCINCGARFDPVIDRNRLAPRAPSRPPDRLKRKPRTPVFKETFDDRKEEAS